MPATMSLLALYNWDNTILDGLSVPDGIVKSVLINNLLRECAELEVLYPQPDAMKFIIREWSKERLPVWDKLARTLNFEYDPISNYDRREEWDNESSGEGEADTAGYNSTDADVPEAKSRTSSRGKTKGRAYGNIGVTTTQQMIEEERRISDFDMDHVIIQEFKKNFCLLVY